MKRIQLFEFEDFNWFPDWLRGCMTNLIVLLQRMLGTSEILANLISEILKEHKINQVVDLGSGSGGVMPDVLRILKQDKGLENINLILTDLYPNPKVLHKFATKRADGLSYYDKSVDATSLVQAPSGLKTMVNSFHHMRPGNAKRILDLACQNRQHILIYEMGENKIPLIIWGLMLPLGLVILMIMALFMTPFVRPLTWQQLVFTYLIPIIPVCYAWDGQASLPRIYSRADLELLLMGSESSTYSWTMGHAIKNNKKRGFYLIGSPN